MANQIVFALRADNAAYAARYSLNSTAAQQIGAGVISYDVDATAINGNCINMAQAGAAQRMLSYPFRGVHTAKAISILMRIKNPSTNLVSFFYMGQPAGLSSNCVGMYQNSNLYQIIAFNDAAAQVANGSFAAGAPAQNVWVDVVLTWDGTTTANKLKLWVDGVATSITASAAWPTTTAHENLNLGATSSGIPNARMRIEEFVVWNYEIDPTNVALVSGNGSLNGASRTSLVDVAAFNGGANTDPGIANVRLSTAYSIAGSSLVGTAAIPTAANVRSGTAVDATTGSLAVPAASNVRSGTAVDNTTGTAAIPTAANVKHGVSTDATTGTYRGADLWTAVDAADIAHSVPALQDGNTITGVYRGIDLWSPPLESNVRSGSGYTSDGQSKTGTLDLPAESNVAEGVTYDGATKTGTYAPPAADFPDELDVRAGVDFDNGNLTGALDLPDASDVRAGVDFDNGTEGTLEVTPENLTVLVESTDNINVIVED